MSTEANYDHEAEQALLAACMQSKLARQRARRRITRDDLWQPAHQAIWDAMAVLDRAGRSVDAVTVLATVSGGMQGIERVVTDIATNLFVVPDHVEDHAAIVHAHRVRRSAGDFGRWLVQSAATGSVAPERLLSEAVTRLQGIRDAGASADVSALTLRELMAIPDQGHEWVIPDLMERGSRLMLTGEEGLGKSALLRQLSIMPAAGVHPFTEGIMPPVKTLIVDCENKQHQVQRQTRPLLGWLHGRGAEDPMDRMMIDTPDRIDVMTDRDLARIHQTIDAFQPDIVILGPIYRMTPRSLDKADEAAAFLAALDTISARGCAIVVEAHAGHGKADAGNGRRGHRELRPRGSSALIAWPEFGLGFRAVGHGQAELEPWRGSRDEAMIWPSRLRRAAGNRWAEIAPDGWGEPSGAYDDLGGGRPPEGDEGEPTLV